MIEFGNTLRAAREAKGMTITQLADATHMTANTIRELESEDFSRLPAPIYGRGFVKLFCEAVGLDPKPLLEEFMAILDGERDASIRERPISAAPAEPESQLADEELEEPAPQERPAPVPEEVISPQDNEPQTEENDVPATESAPPVISQQDLFMKPPQPQAQDFTREPPLQQPVFSAPPVQQPAAEATIPPPPQRQISRYAAPIGQTRAIPSPAYWRIALLGGGALAVCLVALLGLRALYRATTVTPGAPEPTAVEAPATPVAKPEAAAKDATPVAKPAPAAKPAAPAKAPTDAKAKSARTPQKIPALYID